jgi:beta-lactamase class A
MNTACSQRQPERDGIMSLFRTKRLYHAGILATLALLTAAPTGLQSQGARPVGTESPDSALYERLSPLVQQFRGRVGIYVRHLSSGRTVEINADEMFPTASMIKVPIMVAVFDAIERGELEFGQKLTYTDSLLYEGEDILGSFADSSEISLSKVLMLMISASDNTAALWLQHLAGTGTRINEWLEQNGFDSTRVNSRTPGRQPNWEVYGWGQTTPREMAELVTRIRQGGAVSRAASEAMYRLLSRIYWNGEALSQIPPWIQTASKQGAVSESRSEVVLVNAPSGDYVFCVITKDQEDESWDRDNEGYVLIRNVSRILWNHFEPDYPWSPPDGAERYVP